MDRMKKKSLIVSSAIYFSLFTLIIVLVYTAFHYLVDVKIKGAFFTIDDLLAYEDDLIAENYAKIPVGNSKISAFIIFDENGTIQYASNRTIGDKVFFQDLELIGDYISGQIFNVFQETADDGSSIYYVYLNSYTWEDTVPQILGVCILDENYQIIGGDLFSDRDSLTSREFELLCGISNSNSYLDKYVYQNAQGEERILAFLTMGMSDKQYAEIVRSANAIWVIGIPCVLLTIVIFAILFSKMIKRRIAPLNQTIISYEKCGTAGINPSFVPSEFHETVQNFKSLLGQLEQIREEKEVLYQERQKLIADISHDLKTPLTVIQGYAKALSEQRVPVEKQAHYIEAIVKKSKLATDMVSDLFTFTQMEHPNYQMNLEETDFCEFVKSFFAEKYMELTEYGFALSVEIPENRIVLKLDRKLMRRVLENLLSNATNYNPEGTTIFISMCQRDGNIELTVADDGVGIPKEIASTLFQPFVTGNCARTTGKGTGLGLSIVQRIVQMHHGHIHLVLPPHKPYHTEFCILIPKPEGK